MPLCLRTGLDKPREHGVPLLLVLVAKGRPERLLLVTRPVRHVGDADGDEDDDRPLPRDQDDADPCGDFEHVVGRRDQAGADAVGDALLGAAGLAQACQVLVHGEIARLAAQEQREADIVQRAEGRAGRGRPGGVDEVARQ